MSETMQALIDSLFQFPTESCLINSVYARRTTNFIIPNFDMSDQAIDFH